MESSARTRPERLWGAVGVGILAGFLAGLFGVGGGILIVPGLVLLLRIDQRLAHGTSLAAIVPIAAGGIVGFWIDDSVDWVAAGFLSLGAAAGAVAGTRALQQLAPRVLRVAFAALLIATAVWLFVETSEATGRGELTLLLALALVALGIFAGVVAGLFGVGGGAVIVPALVLLFAVPDPIAKGTSLVVILPTALAGTLRNIRYRNTDLRVAAATGVSGVIAAYAAAQLAVRLDARLSSVLFGVLLLAVAARMLLTADRISGGQAQI